MLVKYSVVHKDDMIIARILTHERNPMAQVERADQVVLETDKNRYEICFLRWLRLVHPLSTWFNNEGFRMIIERLILFSDELHPTNFSRFSIAVALWKSSENDENPTY